MEKKKDATIGAPPVEIVISVPDKPEENKPKYPPGQSSLKINPGCRIR